MELPVNRFRQGLREGRQQIGLWNSLPGSYVAEVLAGTGFDWIVVDTEHAPADPLTVLPVLQAMAPYPVAAAVRAAANDAVLIKRLLDLGAQTLVVPYVEDAAQAVAAVAAMRYPPRGIRGVAGQTRASRFGRVAGYARRAEEELCLIVQVETVAAVAAIEAIAAVDGVDGLFIGPADLAASMGHPGEPGHPAVIEAALGAIARIVAAGRPAGVLAQDAAFARACIAAGTTFTAVGSDIGLLVRGAEALARAWRPG